MLFYFCIVIHNGARHILLLDFLWAHPNSLNWSIKSNGPNNVCNAWYIYIYIYIYINEKRKISCSISLLLLLWAGESTHNTFRLNLGCRKWKKSLNLDSYSIMDWALFWKRWSTKMTFHDINQSERFIYSRLIYVLISTCYLCCLNFHEI